MGYDAELYYYLALCHYLLKQHVPSLKYISEIIDHGIREYPELNVGMATENVELRSVGNTQLLHDSFLTEAFNLKASIEFQLKNCN
jgi:tetratricopeptide repeat protein 30